MKIVVVSVSGLILKYLIKASHEVKTKYSDQFELKLFYVGNTVEKNKKDELVGNIIDADMVIVDLMGAPYDLSESIVKACSQCKGNIVPIGGRKGLNKLTKLGSYTMKEMGMGKKSEGKSIKPEDMMKMMEMAEKMGKIMPFGKFRDMKNYIHIGKYFRNASYEDIKNMLFMLLRTYGGLKEVPKAEEPIEKKEIGICDPKTKKYYEDYDDYVKDHFYDSEKGTVAVLYSGNSYPNHTATAVAGIVSKFEKHVNVLPIAFAKATARKQSMINDLLSSGAYGKVDLIINFMPFRLGAGPMGGDAEGVVNMLEKLKIPIIHPFFMTRRKISEWQNSKEGLNSSEFLVTLMLPELDGCIENILVGALVEENYNHEFDLEINKIDLIDERVDKLISRVLNWMELRKKQNKDKRVAIICYNYPPSEAGLFGGAFLDTFESISSITKFLNHNDFTIESMGAQELMDTFTRGIMNSGKWLESNDAMIKYHKGNYEAFLNSEKYKNEMVKQWGKAPGTVMSEDEDFLTPGLINGNVFIGLQPSRGIHENPDKVYHDKELLPHHQYIAYYKWLRDEFNADVIIHVGTHGTIEFLKGKECGMSGDCFPDKLVFDIPHLYLYYCGNPSEAMIAKRRTHAALVSYQPPTFKEGELYGDYLNLETILNEYAEAKRVDPNRLKVLEKIIKEKAKVLNLEVDDFAGIEKELYRMKRSLIPYGLHIFGESYTEEESIDYMKFILRYDRGSIKSLRRLIAENEGLDYDIILNKNDVENSRILDVKVKEYIDHYMLKRTFDFYTYKDDEIKDEFIQSIEFGLRCFETSRDNNELKGLLTGLDGEYINMRLAGDIIRSPEVLPSGSNLFQFDPTLVPTEAAYTRGAEISNNTIKKYTEEKGEYPKSVAIILWGLETSRTQGETVGQIFSYLGVKVKTSGNRFEPEYEIIPLEELGRPRIDITINMCGFFRDMFPNLVEGFNRIFKEIAELEESDEDNYFKANAKKIFKSLIEEGYEEEQAKEFSYSRLFGPVAGEYGTGISKLIETKNWTDEEQIGEMYIKSLKHVYSKNYRGYESEELLNKNLQVVDIVSQIRSNHEYEVTDLDHYYEYFGGLSKSIEMAKGKKAEVFISDTTGEKIETESVNKSIERGVRTRLLNPKWIDGMLEHKYHGVQKIQQRFENILGLAATTNKVEEWIYSNLLETYVLDEEMKRRMMDNNRWAYNNILESMFEYHQRGYWNATEEEINQLRQVYLEIEGEIEGNN
ncbi:MAG: magnesium chelatase subunit H [Halanaerobiales bacterium]|nr:magnesium chelatase subunit H [Halanaerobiales bacterium]